MKAIRYLINGVVQGVGFRPFIYRIALENHLTGWVKNTSAGVELEVEGDEIELEAFRSALITEQPPLARIENISDEYIPLNGHTAFTIKPSIKTSGEYSLVPPDYAICSDCARELFDPSNRRYRYPFINCTNCGPRLTIIKEMPYDRSSTTMSFFGLCKKCESEYNNPLDRRYHAEPIACPDCGPQVTLLDQSGIKKEKEAAIQLTRKLISDGKIIAIKGLGGYLLACDAHNTNTIEKLRVRKNRSQKPFALMAFSSSKMAEYCLVSNDEKSLLESRQMPIVVLDKRLGIDLPEEIAPNQRTLGFMQPYTPLHLLICEPEVNYPDVLIMTSANISDEPILYDDSDTNRLFKLADYVLTNNRPIHIRVDDSVYRLYSGTPVPTRRSRGFAPDPIQLPKIQPEALACGALLKSTVTLTKADKAFVSPYIGDLENLDTFAAYQSTIAHMESVYRVKPEFVACDLHPDFLSTMFARQYASEKNIPLVPIQHHHAHMAACLAENNWSGKHAIGLCFDGTGLGDDGSIWGGEIFLGNYSRYDRKAYFEYMPLPGGDASIQKPYRIALAYLINLGIPLSEFIHAVSYCSEMEKSVINKQITNKINMVYTSSLGRLFDAVASLIGVCHEITYEGQAAIELENIVEQTCGEVYEISYVEPMIPLKDFFLQIISDLSKNIPNSIISAKFHNTVAQISLDICKMIRSESNVQEIALSGGVWQNKYLFEKTRDLLDKNRFTVFCHHLLPTNDGCISYGQAVVLGALTKEGE